MEKNNEDEVVDDDHENVDEDEEDIGDEVNPNPKLFGFNGH